MLIRAGKADELTLEAIGLQSGFVTRNTFFTAVKKVEGISPSANVAKMGKYYLSKGSFCINFTKLIHGKHRLTIFFRF